MSLNKDTTLSGHLKKLSNSFKRELKVYRLVLRDPRTPWWSKFLWGLAVAYALSPVDLIPDFIPVLGHLDDLVVVPALVFLALKGIPPEVIQKYRERLRRKSI